MAWLAAWVREQVRLADDVVDLLCLAVEGEVSRLRSLFACVPASAHF